MIKGGNYNVETVEGKGFLTGVMAIKRPSGPDREVSDGLLLIDDVDLSK